MAKNLPANKTQSKAVAPQDQLRSLMNSPSVKSRFEEMLGKKSAGFISSVLSAVSTNSALSECDPRSVISSAAIAASMDLPINQSLGFAHIVPYKGVAQFQMGWKGYVQLAMRSGQYKTINASIVLEGQIKSQNTFTGEMEFNEKATGDKVVGYLLYFKLINGYEKYFYWTADQCLAHGKKYSQSFKKGFGQWNDNFDAMALKTVVKLGLAKYGILSLEMQQAINSDAIEATPAGRIVQEMAEQSDFAQTERELSKVAVDTVPDYENESQEVETQNAEGAKGDPGEFLVRFGSRAKNPCKLKEVGVEELKQFLDWAYQQEKLAAPVKEYVEAAEAYLEKTAT